MDEVALNLRYMAAHVRLNARSPNLQDWSASEIMDCFAILPPPVRTLPEWRKLVSGELTEEEQIAHNEQALKQLDALDKKAGVKK